MEIEERIRKATSKLRSMVKDPLLVKDVVGSRLEEVVYWRDTLRSDPLTKAHMFKDPCAPKKLGLFLFNTYASLYKDIHNYEESRQVVEFSGIVARALDDLIWRAGALDSDTLLEIISQIRDLVRAKSAVLEFCASNTVDESYYGRNGSNPRFIFGKLPINEGLCSYIKNCCQHKEDLHNIFTVLYREFCESIGVGYRYPVMYSASSQAVYDEEFARTLYHNSYLKWDGSAYGLARWEFANNFLRYLERRCVEVSCK